MALLASKGLLLSSCLAKLARADDHLQTLYRETDEWGDGDPFAITRESNADGSEHLFSLRFKTPPDVWGWALILGDALHNLRGALDHIVYALAIAQSGKDPPDDESRLAFPICNEPKFFKGQRYRIGSLNSVTQAAIEKAQPYHRLKPGQSFMPLWWLSQLHDIDKHRLAHVSVVAAHPDEIVINAPPGTYKALWDFGALVEGAPFFRLLLSEPNPHVYVDLKATAAVVLDLKGIRPISLYWAAERISREVDLICRYLAGFFPPGP